MNRLVVPLILSVGLVACGDSSPRREWRASDHAQPPEAANAPMGASRPLPPEEARAQAGAALFRMQCASCHGARGLGDGPSGRGIAPPNLTTAELQARLSDADLASVIRSGRGAMPGFGRMLDDAAITALVVHVRSLAATPAPAAPTEPPADQ